MCCFISSFHQPPMLLMGKGNLSRIKRFAQKGSPRKRQTYWVSRAGLSPGLQPIHTPLSFLGVP